MRWSKRQKKIWNHWDHLQKLAERRKEIAGLVKKDDFNKARDALIKANVKEFWLPVKEGNRLFGQWAKKVTTPKPVKNLFVELLRKPWMDEEKYTSAFFSSRAYRKFLEKKGFKVIGSGYYSFVLCKGNSNRVIKVGRPDNWIDYILWSSKSGYMGGLAPKVFSYKYHPGKGEGSSPFYVAVMEKLDSTVASQKKTGPHVVVPYIFDYAMSDNDNAKKCLDVIAPKAGEFAKKLKEAFPKYRFDIHSQNFMTRGTELVLIDPLTDQGETYTKRVKDFSKAA